MFDIIETRVHTLKKKVTRISSTVENEKTHESDTTQTKLLAPASHPPTNNGDVVLVDFLAPASSHVSVKTELSRFIGGNIHD